MNLPAFEDGDPKRPTCHLLMFPNFRFIARPNICAFMSGAWTEIPTGRSDQMAGFNAFMKLKPASPWVSRSVVNGMAFLLVVLELFSKHCLVNVQRNMITVLTYTIRFYNFEIKMCCAS